MDSWTWEKRKYPPALSEGRAHSPASGNAHIVTCKDQFPRRGPRAPWRAWSPPGMGQEIHTVSQEHLFPTKKQGRYQRYWGHVKRYPLEKLPTGQRWEHLSNSKTYDLTRNKYFKSPVHDDTKNKQTNEPRPPHPPTVVSVGWKRINSLFWKMVKKQRTKYCSCLSYSNYTSW